MFCIRPRRRWSTLTIAYIRASAEAMKQIFGKETVYIRSGGSIPIVGLFDQHLGIPSVMMGFGLPDDNLHAPNEKIYLPNFFRGIEAVRRYLEILGNVMTVDIEGVTLHLAHPDELPVRWVGQEELMRQLLAAWMVLNEQDLPMNPRLLGKPGVGKTTLAYAAAKRMGRDVYILQATMDTRPGRPADHAGDRGRKASCAMWLRRW